MLISFLVLLASSLVKLFLTSEILDIQLINVAGASFMSNSVVFNFMLDLLSRMNDKDKQQVCGNFRK